MRFPQDDPEDQRLEAIRIYRESSIFPTAWNLVDQVTSFLLLLGWLQLTWPFCTEVQIERLHKSLQRTFITFVRRRWVRFGVVHGRYARSRQV